MIYFRNEAKFRRPHSSNNNFFEIFCTIRPVARTLREGRKKSAINSPMIDKDKINRLLKLQIYR